ncbi:MAG: hypothetical protein COT92_02520 [Candidatus Doudnabacteria bacterium CG10_big_fil_rev_8_21_14_0_10_42_18]|uniref:Uncharacterized protein n=1 Tax=Candidatus Doudnabacteria bacterium CG10_big_fil_rev_8_21_14_0_10_42_18 TaxID=1974552 RepID=A0A2H0VAP3_9BACT|nr:MAG: hypothetical protein COT92_02520 [Candidatus Doudnabacteria bacterium CG10_big_fil_rev_8_21_14_0_10_42_18]
MDPAEFAIKNARLKLIWTGIFFIHFISAGNPLFMHKRGLTSVNNNGLNKLYFFDKYFTRYLFRF